MKIFEIKKRKLCPKCRSPDLQLYAGWYTGSYNCRHCGYLGPLVLEEDIRKSRPRKKMKKPAKKRKAGKKKKTGK